MHATARPDTARPEITRCIAQPPAAPCAQPRAGNEAPAAPPAWAGCGWFDSSHDLRHGLAVHELEAVDLLRLPGGLRYLVGAAR